MSFGGSIKLTGESEYQKALKQINLNLRELSSEMKLATSSYDKNDKSLQALTSQEEVLNKKLTEQSEKVKVLTARYNEVNSQYGKNSTAQKELNKDIYDAKAKLSEYERTLGTSSEKYKEQAKLVKELEGKQESYNKAVSEAKIQMTNAQAEYNKTSVAVDKLSKEVEDAKKPQKQLNEELKDSSKQAKNAGDGFTVFKGIVADLASKAIQTAISGLKKLGAAVVNVGKQAIQSYAEYEQLVGGVETLFKESSDIVQDYANNAYKTAGISANKYMEQVTSFSASLLQSLGQDTVKAAQYGDLAITDMADNANKMGTSMEMIQNAYQGFAKQNFTMLDNLKLGYGGTKTEMKRLIEDANKVKKANGEMATLSIESFADMVEAIHIIQTEMGITGTTAKEAEKTIQGSVNSMKAAWQNLLTGIADDNQDMKKLVNNFVDSVITASKNLVPRIKIAVEGIKKLVMSIVKDVFPKLKKEIPELKPLIETFEWFVKNKTLVVNAVKLMVAAFAVNKITTFTKSLTGLNTFIVQLTANMLKSKIATDADTISQVANTTAKGAATTATNLLTAAQQGLNAAWTANPIGLVITAVTTLITVYSLFKTKTDEATEAAKEQTKAFEENSQRINDNKRAWDDLVDAQQNQINVGMTELSNVKSLYDELTNLTDANGKVKEGYEKRASFILTTLNEALGTEYSMTDNIINKYDELKNSIDKVMEKKKAQIILDSQESLYAEAITQQDLAIQNLNIAQKALNAEKEKQQGLEKQLEVLNAEYLAAATTGNFLLRDYYNLQIGDIEKKIKKQKEETASKEADLNTQQDLIEKYAYNIGQYEQNMALAHEENYDKMSTINWELVKSYQDTGDAKKAQIEGELALKEQQLEILKGLAEKSDSDLYNQQIKANEQRIKELKENLKEYNSTTEEELNKTNIIWNDNLDEQLSAITDKKVEFKEDGKGNVTAYIDGVASGETKSKEEMAKLVTNTINEISKQEGNSEEAGKNLIRGFNNGESNSYLQQAAENTARGFGNRILDRLKRTLGIASPSKETKKMGTYLLEGLGLGIDKEENSVFKQVSSFGKNVLSTLNGSLNEGVGFPSISTGNLKASSISRATAAEESADLVNSFKQALSEMKIELDDENVGKFVDKKVTRLIYT